MRLRPVPGRAPEPSDEPTNYGNAITLSTHPRPVCQWEGCDTHAVTSITHWASKPRVALCSGHAEVFRGSPFAKHPIVPLVRRLIGAGHSCGRIDSGDKR